MASPVQSSFFKTYFPTPRAVRFGLWQITAQGDKPVDEEVRQDAGLAPGATMFTYADALVRYAIDEGWDQELDALLEQDVRSALTDSTYDYIKSRLGSPGKWNGGFVDQKVSADV